MLVDNGLVKHRSRSMGLEYRKSRIEHEPAGRQDDLVLYGLGLRVIGDPRCGQDPFSCIEIQAACPRVAEHGHQMLREVRPGCIEMAVKVGLVALDSDPPSPASAQLG